MLHSLDNCQAAKHPCSRSTTLAPAGADLALASFDPEMCFAASL